jgi:hypothetical protein
LQAGFLQRGHLAGVGEQPLGVRHAGDLDRRSRSIDQQDLVPVVQQLTGD